MLTNETIIVPLEFIRNVAELRRAQLQDDSFRAREMEKIVDTELAYIVNAVDQHRLPKVDRFYDDIDLEVESRR